MNQKRINLKIWAIILVAIVGSLAILLVPTLYRRFAAKEEEGIHGPLIIGTVSELSYGGLLLDIENEFQGYDVIWVGFSNLDEALDSEINEGTRIGLVFYNDDFLILETYPPQVSPNEIIILD